jgi:hypothetical protein
MLKQQPQSTASRVFSLVDMEADIAEEATRRLPHPALRETRGNYLKEPSDYAPRPALPGYVEHREGLDDIGKLSAEAVIHQYENAAKEIETMGAELTARLKKLDATKAEAMLTLDEIRETAARYREEGKRVFLQIEDCALMTAEVRSTCGTLRGKIAGPSS